MQAITAQELAMRIDHTLLRPDAVSVDIEGLCAEAIRFGCRSACVNPRWVEHAAAFLVGSQTVVCAVAGFPLGAGTTRVKAVEAERAVHDGAAEVDMVLDIGGLLDGRHASVRSDIATVRRAVGGDVVLKVILETSLLDLPHLQQACGLAVDAGADFVKTSTGFGPHGATVEAVRQMRDCVGDAMGVKASGGIRDLPTMLAMLEAGADRIGTSSTSGILAQAGGSA